MRNGSVVLWCAACAAGAMALAGCTGQATRVSIEGDGAAGPVAKSPEDYRKVRFAEAMRGLAIRDGLVRVDAEAAGELALNLRPADGAGAIARGESRLAENDFSGAVAEYRTAILADAGSAAGYEGLGDALVCKRKDDMALAAYRTAVMLAPRDADARMKLAETLNRNGDIAGWAAELENVLAIDGGHGEAHARLAVARYYLGDKEAAREEIVLAERFGGAVPPQLRDLVNN
ncbi:MAG TPA: hypothetical protein VFF69_00640 [Phycisphaerales bacterium]|nr:hypothetical protein [Phycisphaerales bacterium]